METSQGNCSQPKSILAVIPARAGSKGVPNKNTRLLNGHPLVYYAIKNALTSKFITDVVVTTDSEIVKIIAKQAGTEYRDRPHDLCADDVTLDSVVYDAIPKDKQWDYIVTMQPTSPTLKVSTLDKAIKYAIDGNYDTVISATNHPHLSWRLEKNKVRPNYQERLNRQYLPPYFIETGAFMISKSSVVTSTTRIGRDASVYEIPADESLDIDDFNDLYVAQRILTEKKIAIFVNGNNTIGMGHIYRVLELSDAFFSKPDIYYDKNQTDRSVFGKTTHNLIPIATPEEFFEKCKNKKYNLVINDILDTSLQYTSALRAALPQAKIVNFEDSGEGSAEADLVFNALYEENTYPHIYTGEQYYIPNKIFTLYNPIKINEAVTKVFISFGGADPQNYTDRLLAIISEPKYRNFDFTVVLGRAKNNIDALMTYNELPNISIFYDVKNMAEFISAQDLAITSRGRTGYELAMLGVPTLTMAQNTREEKHDFMRAENGFQYIGLNPKDHIIKRELDSFLCLPALERQRRQDLMLKHNLKRGCDRIITLINNL